MTPGRETLLTVLSELDRWGSERNWAGTDPYDGLNASRFAKPLKRSILGRRILTQLVKHSPLNLRPLLGVPQEHSSAALAAVLSAYSVGDWLPEAERDTRVEKAARALLKLRCDGFQELCWGYHFDVQTRVFFYPRGMPNTIATAFAGMALIDAGRPEEAASAARFFLAHVPQTPAADGQGAFFGYLPDDRTPIHNASMLAAALLARVGEGEMLKAAEAAVEYTVSRQRPDGSWPYGELPHLGWVDGFHTGYVLECLHRCLEAGVGGDAAREALRLGLEHYRRDLFLDDGTPKYMPDELYPVDCQCVAQGIQTFALAGDPFAWTVFDYGLRRMRRRDGAFAFQRRRLWVNRTPHVRWVQAPMLTAMAHLSRAKDP